MTLVTILGGTGAIGSRIARALAREPGLKLRIAARTAPRAEQLAQELGAAALRCDWQQGAQLEAAVAGAQLVVHAAGPFQGQDLRVARAALAAGAHYLDLSDARAHALALRELDEAAKSAQRCLLSSASICCALTHAMVAELAPDFDTINEIHFGIALGQTGQLGPAWAAGLESERDQPLRMRLGGEWTERKLLGDERWLEFPPPAERQRGYNLAWPELELFPATWRSQMVRISGVQPQRAGLVARLFGGKSEGAPAVIALWMRGADGKRLPRERRLALLAGEDACALAAAPVVELARRVLAGDAPRLGAGPAAGGAPWERWEPVLRAAGIAIRRGDMGGWK